MKMQLLGSTWAVLAFAACGGTSAAPTDRAVETTSSARTDRSPRPPAGEAKPKRGLAATPDDRLGTSPASLGLKVGEKASDLTLDDAAGGKKRLGELLASGPIFVVFYRGGWCPFCNMQLHELAKAGDAFRARGVGIVAISVDRPDREAETRAKQEAPFPFLSDPDLIAHQAFHVVHDVGPEEAKRLADYGIDFAAYSGKEHKRFAVPSVFLLDRAGVVRFAHVDEDYKTRPSAAQLLAIVDRLKGEL